MDNRWLSVEEIGEYLGVSKDTVCAWVVSTDMPGHRGGRFWKFRRKWVRVGGAAGSDQRLKRRG